MDWKNVEKETLEKMLFEENKSVKAIADYYHVAEEQVTLRCRREKISLSNYLLEQCMTENPEIFDQMNRDARARLCAQMTIDQTAASIAQFIFQDSPAEDMLTAGKLTKSDLQNLQRHLSAKLGQILTLIAKDKWWMLEMLCASSAEACQNLPCSEPSDDSSASNRKKNYDSYLKRYK